MKDVIKAHPKSASVRSRSINNEHRVQQQVIEILRFIKDNPNVTQYLEDTFIESKKDDINIAELSTNQLREFFNKFENRNVFFDF